MKKKEKRIFDLSKPLNPDIVNELSDDELQDLANCIKKEIVEKCSKYGGHLSSNLGVAELMCALFSFYDFPKDKLILDVGHQSYAQKILSGRTLDHLREENGVDGFQKREESIYDVYEAGHSSTSISAAMGMALARDLNHEDYEVIAVIGDASIANGLSLEALNNLSEFHHRLIIILNDNEMSITEPVGGFNKFLQKIRISKKYITSKSKYKKALSKNKFTRAIYRLTSSFKRKVAHHLFYTNLFEDLGILYAGVIEGTDISMIKNTLKKLKGINEPILVHVCTAKGNGYFLAEEDKNGKWHSVKPFDIESGQSKEKVDDRYISWTDLFAMSLDKLMEEDNSIVSINAATRCGGHLSHIMKKYPDRYFDVGISEEHAVVFANGIAANNGHPYVTMYSTFLQRAYDEILHDVARMDLGVTFLIDHAGLVGQDGETHQGIFDVDFMINMPNVTIAMPDRKETAIRLMKFSKDFAHPLAIRYTLSSVVNETINENIEAISYGEWEIIKKAKTNDLAIVSMGEKVHIIKMIEKDFTLYNAIFLSTFKDEYINDLLNYKKIIIYDPYGIKDGFSCKLSNILREKGYQNEIKIVALESKFVKKGTIAQQEKREFVDIDSLKKEIYK